MWLELGWRVLPAAVSAVCCGCSSDTTTTHSPSGETTLRIDDPRPCATAHSFAEMSRHQLWNRVALPLVEAANISILRVWAGTALAGDAHINYGDCTHYCLPGPPNEWARLLAAMLRHQPLRPLASGSGARRRR